MARFQLTNIPILMSVCAGCCQLPPADDGMVGSLVSGKTNHCVEWTQGCCLSSEAEQAIQCLLSEPLTPDSAIRVALLNNQGIQALFEEVGVAQADLIEAGLFTNPVFSVEVRYPFVDHLKTNIEYTITACILDLFLIPIRVRVAEAEYEQVKLKVSNGILDLAFDVRECFYALNAEKQKVEAASRLLKIAQIGRDLAAAQHAAGNLFSLPYLMTEAHMLETEIARNQAVIEVVRLNEKLHRLLGLPTAFCLDIVPICSADVVCPRYELCALEQIAFEERLDLHAARLEIERICAQLGLSEWWAYTQLQIGIAGERDTDGANVLGPGFAGEIPIFNYGQAARRRLYARLRQSLDRLRELQVNVSSEVREAYHVLQKTHALVLDYREKLLPMQNRIVEESEGLYNVMGLGVDQLLGSRSAEIGTEIGYIDSLKQYLIAEVELDRALGGYLPLLVLQRECMEASCE